MTMSTADSSKGSTVPSVDLYKPLPFKNQRVVLGTSAPFTPTFVASQFSQSSDPAGLYASRVQGHQILLENPAKKSKVREEREKKRERREQAKIKEKSRLLGVRQGIDRGLWKLEKSQTKFDLFLPLHHLWLGYMSELLGLQSHPPKGQQADPKSMPNAAGMHAKLVKADFHGSLITVRQSKNPSIVGLSGIVVHETENTFKLVNRKNALKVIPKGNSVFAFAVPLYSTLPSTDHASDDASGEAAAKTTVLDKPHIEFDLHGNQFRFRSADRAGRKFKHKETIEL